MHDILLIALRPVVPSRHLSPFLAVPQSGGAVPQLRPTAVPSPPSDNHSSTGVAGSTPSEVSVLRGLVHQMINVCQSNQQQLSLLRGEVSQLREELRAVEGNPSSFIPGSKCSSLQVPNLMPRVILQGVRNKSLPGVQCNFAGPIARVRDARCTRAGHPVVPTSGFCEAHCTSSVADASRPCLFLQWVW